MAKEKIYIYHTNDLHSDFHFWPRLRAELLERRVQHEQAGDLMLVFDIGDAADRAHPLIEATEGQAMTRLFNEAKVNAVTIGNNEGTTYSIEALNALYKEADFSVLLANLVDTETTERPAWAEEYKIIKTKSGAKIGVFGLTEPIYDAYESLGWTAMDPIDTTRNLLAKHQNKADFWILLSHLGIDEDKKLAENFPLGLILGAHTHHVLKKGEEIAGTWLAGAGSAGRYLGEIQLVYQDEKLKVEQIGLLDTLTDIKAVEGEETQNAAYLSKGHELLSEESITYITKTYEKALFENSPLMDLVLDAIADFAETDVAFLNAGLLMEDLKEGKVTADHLHQMLPHPIRVMHCEIKGKDLPELMEELAGINEFMQDKAPTGNGFRGKQFGKMCFKGITVREGQVYWLNKPVEQEKTYAFATLNYLSFYSIFEKLNVLTKQRVFFPELLREVFGNYLAQMRD